MRWHNNETGMKRDCYALVLPILDENGNSRTNNMPFEKDTKVWMCSKCKRFVFYSLEDAINHELTCIVKEDSLLEERDTKKSNKCTVILSPLLGSTTVNAIYSNVVVDVFKYQLLQNSELFENKSSYPDQRNGHICFRCMHCKLYMKYPFSISHMCAEKQLLDFYNHLIKDCPFVPPKRAYQLHILLKSRSTNESQVKLQNRQFLSFCHHYFTMLGIVESIYPPPTPAQSVSNLPNSEGDRNVYNNRIGHLKYSPKHEDEIKIHGKLLNR